MEKLPAMVMWIRRKKIEYKICKKFLDKEISSDWRVEEGGLWWTMVQSLDAARLVWCTTSQ